LHNGIMNESSTKSQIAEILAAQEKKIKEILVYYDERKTSVDYLTRNLTQTYLHHLKGVLEEIDGKANTLHPALFFRLQGEARCTEILRQVCLMDVQVFHVDYNSIQTRQRLQTMRWIEHKLTGILAKIHTMQALLANDT
jgi:hypothetical protein